MQQGAIIQINKKGGISWLIEPHYLQGRSPLAFKNVSEFGERFYGYERTI